MSLMDYIFSFPCPACRDEYEGVDKGNRLCCKCVDKLVLNTGTCCPACGGPLDGILEVCTSCLKEDKRPWKKALALFQMKGFGQELVHDYKYNNRTELARAFGQMAVEIIKNGDIKYDLIVPVPLHWTRFLKRGYNQAELLCRDISRRTGIPVKRILRRKKWTRQQARLNRDERRKNIKGVFSLKREAKNEKRTILLVDDVLTTGSTLASATETLLDSGVEEVYILILARGY